MSKCIIWPDNKDKDGYGRVKIAGKQCRAHRVALAKKLGRELRLGELALHDCDNASCVNPEHLRPGSVADNNRQSRAKRPTLAQRILGVDGYGYGESSP